ncbi:MAG: SMC family ATPase, partial [Thermoplasmata archaeon]|nr:SMC family ATPase [Thermoplasmata archaeon]
MRLVYLQLKNYRRFRDLELEFPDGLVGVIGLNGAGKSSLLEAVAWVLYGNEKAIVRTGRESVKRQDSAHSDPCEVVLEFELNRTMYRVQRRMVGKALTMTATLLADGKIMATGTKETTEAVVKLLGMDYKAFFISVFAQQKELNALTTLQPAARRKE